jgi:hypothetical protein
MGGDRMKTKLNRPGKYWILGLVLTILFAGCVPSAQAVQTATPFAPLETATTTPDPLYTLHCIRQSGNSDLCYAGEMLIGNSELLEKVTMDFCNAKDSFLCSIMIWQDEASVAQKVPLTDTEEASRIARFTRRPNTGLECFQSFANGEVVYSSEDCE